MKNHSVKIAIALSILFLQGIGIATANTPTRCQLLFENNSAAVTEASSRQLSQCMAQMSLKALKNVQVIGHTDGHGSIQSNLLLSQRRADQVADLLVRKGVSASVIQVKYLGESMPLVSNSTEAGRMQNRRVELIFTSQNPFLSAFLPEVYSFEVNAEQKSQLTINSHGTVLHIPANAFITKTSERVKGKVQIHFQEYRNAADMAFSEIPMTYKGGFFNSSGMFQISGTAAGEALQIAGDKSLSIDYALAADNGDLAFYKLNDSAVGWNKLQDLAMVENVTSASKEELRNKVLEAFEQEKGLEEDPILTENNKGAAVVNQNIIPIVNKTPVDNGNRTEATLLGGGKSADPGHFYPNIIRGLNVSSFGVYNCDQVYRLPDLLSIKASYVDQQGNPIKKVKVLSLIDLRYNGAFSSYPSSFFCSASGDNVLALFTQDNKLYLLSKEAYKEMHITESGSYTFVMEDMTQEIKNTEDMAKYLKLKGA